MNARTLALTLLAATTFAGVAHAEETVVATFLPRMGASLQYGTFGYTNDAGDYTPLTGNQIVKTEVIIDFTPAAGIDPAVFFTGMVVPTTGSSQFISVDGTQLIAQGDGSYRYEWSSDDYNGTIYAGRFSIDCYGMDPVTGDFVSLIGSTFSDDTGFHFTVAVPEPTTLTALAGAGLMVARRRRR